MHGRQRFDWLVGLGVFEHRDSDGSYYCKTCKDQSRVSTREELWERHFEFLLDRANDNLGAGKHLVHFASDPVLITQDKIQTGAC